MSDISLDKVRNKKCSNIHCKCNSCECNPCGCNPKYYLNLDLVNSVKVDIVTKNVKKRLYFLSNNTKSLILKGAKYEYSLWITENPNYTNYFIELGKIGGLNFKYIINNNIMYKDSTNR